MKILLLGEYSSLHWNLAEGLRILGHNVTVASDGDGFKKYKRDINLERKSSGIKDTFSTMYSVLNNLRNFKGYDVVQLINPCFTQLNININAYLYSFLQKHNKKVFLGAFGVDSYWIRGCLDKKTFRYSEFYNMDDTDNNLSDCITLKNLWLDTKYESLNKHIANTCNGIIACLYEYYVSYQPHFNDKLAYIPLPIISEEPHFENSIPDKIKFFIGINQARNEFKGTDILKKVLLKLQEKFPDDVEVIIAESIEYEEYRKMLLSADVVLDQLYSYTPAMNGLLALSKGKLLIGGGEPEMYELLGEKENKPIINVYPSESDIFKRLENIILNKNKIPQLSRQGQQFVEKHHNHVKVAEQYLNFWSKMK